MGVGLAAHLHLICVSRIGRLLLSGCRCGHRPLRFGRRRSLARRRLFWYPAFRGIDAVGGSGDIPSGHGPRIRQKLGQQPDAKEEVIPGAGGQDVMTRQPPGSAYKIDAPVAKLADAAD